MKNIQIIDRDCSCPHAVYSCEDEIFLQLFPNGQDVEFFEDFYKRVGDKKANNIYKKLQKNLINKKEIEGIHGSLFFELEYKKKYYPTKKESEAIALPD